MHVLVATDGQLQADRAAQLTAALAGPDGAVTVITIVEIPRRFLTELRSARATSDVVMLDHEDVSVVSRDVRERDSWPGDDAVIERYLHDQQETRCQPVAQALEAVGIEPAIVAREGENAAKDLIEAITELDVDVLVIGARGSGFFDGLLGSTSTKLIRQAPCPVLVIRPE